MNWARLVNIVTLMKHNENITSETTLQFTEVDNIFKIKQNLKFNNQFFITVNKDLIHNKTIVHTKDNVSHDSTHFQDFLNVYIKCVIMY